MVILAITVSKTGVITSPLSWPIAGHMPSLGLLQSKTLPGSGRKLFDLTINNVAPIAEEGIKQIKAFYRIEAQIRGLSTDERLAARCEKTLPHMQAFEQWLTYNRAQVSAKSPTGLALKYIAKYWDGLNLFLTDGRIEINNNTVERCMRPIALNRKNALFAGHDAGAQNWAMLASIIETCKLNKVEPHAYLTGVLTAIARGHKQKDIKQLLVWNFGK
ncbi:MAG: transposase [bacterium]|jgi:transposase